jgi:hypothetical protein
MEGISHFKLNISHLFLNPKRLGNSDEVLGIEPDKES